MTTHCATLEKKMANAESLKDAGNRYFKNEEYSKAINCYKEGLQLDPGNPTLNCNLAQAYLAVKEFAEAEVHAVVTLALQADSVKGFYRATKAALGMAKKERALSYLRTGLLNCPKAEELRSLYDEINKEYGDAVSLNTVNLTNNLETEECMKESDQEASLIEEDESDMRRHVSESDCGDRLQRDQSKQRSRSAGSCNRNTSKNTEDKANVRSTSINRSTNENPKCKKLLIPNDKFIDTLVKVQSELSADEKSPQLREREALMEKQKILQAHMKGGTEAFEIGLTKQASERYKCALDIMSECNVEVFGLSAVDRMILKYSLSICWIETLNYNNIVQSVGCLTEIETYHAVEFPAVYYGLGRAFYQLNRFKVALQHLDKGVEAIQKNLNIIPHRWPGTMKTITETTDIGLKESIEKLVYECKTYREPDAMCRYKKCFTVSPHICPSEIIFCSDPDFVGYVVIICQENCKITYHVGCWKHYKENLSSVGKLSDKDVLGQACLTSDCITERNEMSPIVRIEVYGDDGKIKASCSKEPTRTDNVNEHRKEKKKKNEKAERPIKVKPTRPRARKLTPTTQNTPKKLKRKITISSEEFAVCIQRLTDLRKINFSLAESMLWDPQRNYFGRQDIADLTTYLNPHNNKDSETLKEKKDFIFTYFYEYLNDEGPQKISVIEKKWHEEASQFSSMNEFISQHDGMCDFLLQSYRFACIDDYLCLTGQLADTYHTVQEEVGESIAFILNHSSHSIETELEGESSLANQCDDKLVEHVAAIYNVSEHTHLVAVNGSDSPTEQWTHVGSICDSSIAQETSDLSSDEETDYDGIEITDSENEYNYENEKKENHSVVQPGNIELNNTQKHLQTFKSTSSSINGNVVQTVDIPSGSAETLNAGVECQDILLTKDQQSKISDVAVQYELDNHLPILNNVGTQTDSHYDFVKEIETLNTLNFKLKAEALTWNDERQNLIVGFQKEMEDHQQKVQMYESKITSLVAEKEKNINDFQHEVAIRDNKLEIMKKKHQEQIEKHSKTKEEDVSLLKKNLESMTELNKEVEKQANIINRLEGQLRKSNEQVLNIRKLFGEYKLDSYLMKCKERLHCMNAATKYLQEVNTPSIHGINDALEAWEDVARKLQETRDLLQVQYDILSQQLKNKVSSDCLLQLELAELPKEPQYPLQDMNDVIHLALEYVQYKRPEQASRNINEVVTNNHSSHFRNQSNTYPPPLLANSSYQSHSELYGMMSTNSYGYRPPFFASHYSAFPRAMPSNVGQQFKALSPNESSSSTLTRSWSTELPTPTPALKKDKPESMVFGDKLFSDLPNGQIDQSSNNMAFRHISCKSTESLSSGESEIRGTTIKAPDAKRVPCLIPDTKHSGVSGEKKNNFIAGLTPIEITKSGVSDIKVHPVTSTKPINSEIKQVLRTPKHWNYQRLLEEIQKNFSVRSEAELSECLFIIREKNGNKLSGLSVPTIIHRVEKLLEEGSNKKVGCMGMDKFGGTAWGEVKEKDVNWQNDDLENECVICHINMDNSKIKLQCKHSFHPECIRKWLHTNSTCPICRKYTRLVDEFPPLS